MICFSMALFELDLLFHRRIVAHTRIVAAKLILNTCTDCAGILHPSTGFLLPQRHTTGISGKPDAMVLIPIFTRISQARKNELPALVLPLLAFLHCSFEIDNAFLFPKTYDSCSVMVDMHLSFPDVHGVSPGGFFLFPQPIMPQPIFIRRWSFQ